MTLENLPPNSLPVRPNFDYDNPIMFNSLPDGYAVYSDSIFLLLQSNDRPSTKAFKPKTALNVGLGAYIEGARPTHAS